jgi:hypothetical protein
MAGPPAYIVLKNLDYQNEQDLRILSDMSDSLSFLE